MIRSSLPLTILLALAAVAAGHDEANHPGHPDHPLRWFRGNTHSHTVRCGHADSEPEAVAKWYLDRGYHFLCLSEHNQFIDPATVKLPEGRREDFILIPGEEITGEHVHMTGLNVNKLVGWVAQGSKSRIIQTYTDRTRDVEGVPIINHPNFMWALTAADIRPVKRCYLFELYNGHPSVHNDGDADHPSTEAMWDDLLTDGMAMYGVSSDDAHEFKGDFAPRRSNPGRGWVMVHAAELTPHAISDAIDHGRFYASSGVFLKEVAVSDASYRVVIDHEATEAEVKKPEVLGKHVEATEQAKEGYLIEFIGPGGKVLKTVEAQEGDCPRDAGAAYLRARITYTHKTADGALIRHFAWTQPAFTDGRLEVRH